MTSHCFHWKKIKIKLNSVCLWSSSFIEKKNLDTPIKIFIYRNFVTSLSLISTREHIAVFFEVTTHETIPNERSELKFRTLLLGSSSHKSFLNLINICPMIETSRISCSSLISPSQNAEEYLMHQTNSHLKLKLHIVRKISNFPSPLPSPLRIINSQSIIKYSKPVYNFLHSSLRCTY